LVKLGDSSPATDALNQPGDSFCQRSISWVGTRLNGFWFIFSEQWNQGAIDER